MNLLQSIRTRREIARKAAGIIAIIEVSNLDLEVKMRDAQITNEDDKAHLQMELEKSQAESIISYLKR